jgi:hypothetical protein
MTSFGVSSQTLNNYGIKLGVAASNPIWKVGSQSYEGAESRMGMNVGLFLNWGLTNNLSLLTEMHYIQKGLRFYQPVVNTSGGVVEAYVEATNPNVNYISFPIFIKYDLITSEVTPYIIGGLRVDFMISKSEINNPRWLYSNVNNYDIGGSMGLGVQTKSLLGIGTGLEIRYSPSFIKVDSSPMADITNRSFEINIVIYR